MFLHLSSNSTEYVIINEITIMNKVPITNPRWNIVTGKDKIPAPIIVFTICVEAVLMLEVPVWLPFSFPSSK